MIVAYNIRQIFGALFRILLGSIAYALAALFFYGALRLIAHSFHLPAVLPYAPVVIAAILALITIVGIIRSRKEEPYYNFYHSGLRVPASNDIETRAANQTIHRVTGPAYLLGQIFLSGPLQFIAALRHLRNIIIPTHGLESRLHSLLQEINARNQWEDAGTYSSRSEDLALLIRMKKVDYSPTRKKLRAKP